MDLVVTLRKEVDSIEQAQQLYDWLKAHLEERPEIVHRAYVGHDLTILDHVPPGD